MSSVRRPGMRKTIEVTSPYDNPFTATIARATNREDVERLNMFGKVRTIQNQATPDEVVVERDMPMGDVQVDTIQLCLVKWDIEDENGRVYPITRDNILDLLTGAERRWLHDAVMDHNPIWKGEDEEKADSEESLSPSSVSSSPEKNSKKALTS